MKNIAYEIFVDVWRLICRYQFQRMDAIEWKAFIDDADRLIKRYRGTDGETLFRLLFQAVQTFYEGL